MTKEEKRKRENINSILFFMQIVLHKIKLIGKNGFNKKAPQWELYKFLKEDQFKKVNHQPAQQY